MWVLAGGDLPAEEAARGGQEGHHQTGAQGFHFDMDVFVHWWELRLWLFMPVLRPNFCL